MRIGLNDYQGSARQAYDAILYGGDNDTMSQYLLGRIDSQSQLFGHTPDYYADLRAQVERYNSAFAQEKMRQLASRYTLDTDVDVGVVHRYQDEDQIRNASVTMQEYLMALPVVLNAYREQRVDGWSDTYVDRWPGLSGQAHPTWMRVNDGQSVYDEEADSLDHHYYWSSLDDGRQLSHYEQADILSTWDHLANLMALGKTDPTDIYGGAL